MILGIGEIQFYSLYGTFQFPTQKNYENLL